MKNRLKLRFIASLYCFAITYLYAHKDHSNKPKMPSIGVVQGTIQDSLSSLPLEYASVSLVELEHNELVTGGLTDKNGYLNITEIPLGRYVAVVEFIGYEKKEIGPINLFPGQGAGIKHNLGKVKLNISAVNLGAVEVVGEESTFIQTIDKKIFNVGRDLSSSGGTGTDVLRKVPSVDVDIDGVVTIAGDANVTVLIDGKRSGRTGSGRRGNVDRRINAAMIEKVEVITNPSAKYDPDGVGGIINIVMKRGALDGFNGTVSSMVGEYRKQNLNGNLNYRTEKLNVFTNANYRTGNRIGDGKREFDYIYPSYTDSINTDTYRKRTPNDFGMRFGGDYYPSKASTIGYTFDISQHNETTIQKFNYRDNTINPSLLGNLETTETDEGLHMDHVFSYENKFDSDAELLNAYVSYSYEVDDVNEIGTMDSEYGANFSGNSTTAYEDNNNFTASIDYENKFGDNLDYEIGAKATIRDFKKDLTYLQNIYENDYEEDIYAAYMVTQYELTDRFGFKFGARAEQVETFANLKGPELTENDSVNVLTYLFKKGIEEGPYDPNYFKIYPSAFLLFKLTDRKTIQFGYSKKVNRPGRRTISPFPDNTYDITRLRNGNPYLKPEYSDVMELTYSSNSRKINLSISTSHKKTKDVIMWWDRDYITFDSTTYEIMSAGNADNSVSQNFSGNIMYRPMPLASIMMWGWGWNSFQEGRSVDGDGKSRGFGFGGRLTLNIPTIARLELSGNGRAKMKISTGEIPANYRINLGVQKSFLQNKLSATFKVDDIFNTGKFIIDTESEVTNSATGETYRQLMYAERQRQRRFASIVLNYNFGKQQKKKWGKGSFSGRSGGMGGGMDMDY
ncbi:MAG: TonB-dependent receptor domain-containing protein [Candidatus Neomarinimicrobiota bacterium]